jgi:hypothetical protein
MNPESRIKLIRSLEEIKIFEENFSGKDSPKTRLFNRFFSIIFYFALVVFAYGYDDFKQKILMVITMAIPTIAYSIWLVSKNKSDERFKLIANAILELGSIAQESHTLEIIPKKIESKVSKGKKQITKRKKK